MWKLFEFLLVTDGSLQGNSSIRDQHENLLRESENIEFLATIRDRAHAVAAANQFDAVVIACLL